MTNLLLAGPTIPRIKPGVYSLTADANYPTEYLFGHSKAEYFKSDIASSGDHRFSFSGGATAAANFIYIGKANLLQGGGVDTVTLKGHSANNYAAGTTVHNATSFTSATLYGPDGDDYYSTFATSSAFAYWWVNYNAASATYAPHSKLFFGTYVDPGLDPTSISFGRTRASGARRRAAYTVSLQWSGLTYTNATALHDTFSRTKRYAPAVLFTTSVHEILLGHRVLFGRVLECSIEPTVTDVYSASLEFEELP